MSLYPVIYTESNKIDLQTGKFDSRLEIPSGKDPKQNAWLTLNINYSLNFIDSKNLAKNFSGKDIILKRGDGKKDYFVAVDSNQERIPIMDWDAESKQAFHEKFKKGESFWNHKFLLETPANYAGLDFTGQDGRIYRPNILCLFRLHYLGGYIHLPLNIVRVDPKKDFRSNEFLYDHTDVDITDKNTTLWHELGHALNQLHIQALASDNPFLRSVCKVYPNIDGCYVTPKWIGPKNIMGEKGERGLHPVNAKGWLEAIYNHTGVSSEKWIARMSTSILPREIRRA